MIPHLVEGTAAASMVAIHGIHACGGHVPCSVYATAALMHAAVGAMIFYRCLVATRHVREDHAG